MRLALTAALAMLAGCSAIVGGGGDAPVRCVEPAAGQPDPCQGFAEGMWRCVSGFCQQVEQMRETCNGVDDDLDGVVDNGLDEDLDGFTWCPTGPSPGDCDDTNEDVHPAGEGVAAAAEVCDGADNDCDPGTRDGAAQCTESQDCNPATGLCVDITCATRAGLCSAEEFCNEEVDPPRCFPRDLSCLDPRFPCTPPERCNPATGACVAPLPSGSPCNFDVECASTLCVLVDALRLASEDVSGASGICSRTCCEDSDCDSGSRCWESGSGARACVPEEVLARGTFGAPGARTCAGWDDCGAEYCRIEVDDAYRLDDRVSFACGAPWTTPNSCGALSFCLCSDGECRLDFCSQASDCPSGLCVGGLCRDSCRHSDDCADVLGTPPVCSYAYFDHAGREHWVTYCSYRETGSGTDGAACTSDADCHDQTCVGVASAPAGSSRFCADACCSDSSCGNGEQCRPLFVHGRWEMHCLPRPTFGSSGASTE